MLTPVAVLAAVAAVLFLISFFPQTQHYPTLAVGGFLLAVAVFLIGRT